MFLSKFPFFNRTPFRLGLGLGHHQTEHFFFIPPFCPEFICMSASSASQPTDSSSAEVAAGGAPLVESLLFAHEPKIMECQTMLSRSSGIVEKPVSPLEFFGEPAKNDCADNATTTYTNERRA